MLRPSRRLLLASLAAMPFATASRAADRDLILAPRPPGPDEALVYVWRQWAFKLGMRELMVRINGVKAIYLGTEQYTWLYLKAGDYEVSARKEIEIGSFTSKGKPMAFDGGKTYYLHLHIRQGDLADDFSVELTPVVESAGLSGMRGEWKGRPKALKYHPPEPAIAELGGTDK